MPDFNSTIVVGKIRQTEICNIIKKKYPSAYVVDGYFKGYDIYVPEANQSVEVKQDYKSKYTGNFVVEMEFDFQPSGLRTTTANWWVFVDRELFIWITPNSLRKLISNLSISPAIFIGTGDTKEKTAYLLPKDKLISFPDAFVVKRKNEDTYDSNSRRELSSR